MFRKLLIILLCLALVTATACTPTVPPAASPSAPADAPAQTPAASEEPAQSPAADPTEEPADPDEPLDLSRISDALMQTETFSVALLQNLKMAYTEDNSLFSPLALNAAMAALYAAADGDTEEELRVLMGYQTEPEDTVEALSALLNAVDKERFTVANDLYLTKRVQFAKNYLNDVAAPLSLDAQSLDFSDQAAVQSIAKDAQTLTGSELEELDKVLATVSPATTLMTVSGFSLGASFDQPFNAKATQEGRFESPTGITKARMMTGEMQVGYAEDEYMQMVSLPMNDGAMQLKLILPREGAVAAFDEAMIQYADAWLSQENVSTQNVLLTVPAFTLSSGTSYREALILMGLNKTTRPQTANFAAMQDPALTLPAALSDVVSVGSLSIAENGINLRDNGNSAATAFPPSEESIELTFDRPFLVAVTDAQTGALLAFGCVNQVGSAR